MVTFVVHYEERERVHACMCVCMVVTFLEHCEEKESVCMHACMHIYIYIHSASKNKEITEQVWVWSPFFSFFFFLSERECAWMHVHTFCIQK